MRYFIKTFDPFPVSSKHFTNTKEVYDWIIELKKYIPYKIRSLDEGIKVIWTDDEEMDKFEMIFIEDSKVHLPQKIVEKICKKKDKLLKAIVEEEDEIKKSLMTNQRKKLTTYLNMDIKDINFIKLNELLKLTH